jgi:uncharacterized damage-inducible protein DinB
MSTVEQQIVETWNIHQRIMLFALENLPDEALKATLSTRGGRDIGKQFAHVHNTRLGWLESFAKKHKIELTAFSSEVSPSRSGLLKALRASGEAMASFIELCVQNDGKAPGFKRGIVPMLGYLISHESHHLGHAILTMKQSGIRIPEPLKWGIWEWNKI